MTENQLYKVLVTSEYGGGNFRFYEIITDQKEFNMLLGDEEIKEFVKPGDIKTANFIFMEIYPSRVIVVKYHFQEILSHVLL